MPVGLPLINVGHFEDIGFGERAAGEGETDRQPAWIETAIHADRRQAQIIEDPGAFGERHGLGLGAGRTFVDIGFSQDMIVHHEQAVLMAQIARNRTTDPKVAALAAGIEDSQLLDIGALRAYLALWQAPVLPSGPPMTWMADHAATPGMSAMPGMATTDEINELRTAKGNALDVLFLQLMLRHHDGGLGMLDDAGQHASIEAVRALANRMAFDQRQESQTLAALLATKKS